MHLETPTRPAQSAIWLIPLLWAVNYFVARRAPGVLHVIMRGEWTALGQVQFVVGDAWIVATMVSSELYALLQKVWPSTLGSTARLATICGGAR